MKWDLKAFDQSGNIPSVVASIDPVQFSNLNNIRVLDLAIKVPGSKWKIPSTLKQFYEPIFLAANHQESLEEEIDYVYITVDQKSIKPFSTQRRPGWHSDAFVSADDGTQIDALPGAFDKVELDAEYTYVAYDSLPTLFVDGPFNVGPVSCDEVLKSFEEQAEGRPVVTFMPYTLICLTPYCVHRSAINNTNHVVNRTFIKIQFSKKKYNRTENTRNPAIDYTDWDWVSRNPVLREHRYV